MTKEIILPSIILTHKPYRFRLSTASSCLTARGEPSGFLQQPQRPRSFAQRYARRRKGKMNQQLLHNYGVSLHEETGDKFGSLLLSSRRP